MMFRLQIEIGKALNECDEQKNRVDKLESDINECENKQKDLRFRNEEVTALCRNSGNSLAAVEQDNQVNLFSYNQRYKRKSWSWQRSLKVTV